MSGYGGCSTSLSNNCGDAAPAFPQSSKAFPRYAVLGFLFIFVMAVFIVIFLIRTRQLCMDIRNQQDANLHLGAHRTSRSQASETALPVNPVEPLLRVGQGLDAAFIQTLPLFSYKKGGFPDSAGLKGHIGDCSVCLNEYQEGEGVRLLPGCNHVFHQECVDTWLLSHTSCPICRSNIQVKKQSSLRRMLSLLSGRYQIDSSQDGGSNGNNPGLAVTLTVVSQESAPPPAPSAESQAGQDTAASASGTEERTQLPVGEISQAAREGSFVGEHVAIVVAPEHAGELESEQEAERRMLGSNRKRRPGSEDIRWAAPDAAGLESVTPRPVKRAFSLGREQASVGHGWAPLSISYDRRHSFTERLRNSMRRDPSLLRSLSRPQALALQSGDSTAEAEASDHVVDLEAATTSSVSTT